MASPSASASNSAGDSAPTTTSALPISRTLTSSRAKEPSHQHLSSSPASTTGSFAGGHPRSASSGSSILSASMMRRGVPGAFPSTSVGSGHSVSASISLEKAQATQEAQGGESRWRELLSEGKGVEDDLARASRDDGALARGAGKGGPSTTPATKTSRGWPAGGSAAGGSASAGISKGTQERRASSLSSSSVFEALTGRKMGVQPAASATGAGGAAGEMRKLLKKP